MARDFRDPAKQSGTWWEWTPTKAALEYLWRSGELAIARRERFEKVYDLTERVLPKFYALGMPTHQAHIDWACSAAMERLIIASAPEIRGFWRAISLNLESAVEP